MRTERKVVNLRYFLRMHRTRRNLTLSQVGEVVGASKQMICDIEHGRRSPSRKLEQRLVQFFGIPAEELLAVSEGLPETG